VRYNGRDGYALGFILFVGLAFVSLIASWLLQRSIPGKPVAART